MRKSLLLVALFAVALIPVPASALDSDASYCSTLYTSIPPVATAANLTAPDSSTYIFNAKEYYSKIKDLLKDTSFASATYFRVTATGGVLWTDEPVADLRVEYQRLSFGNPPETHFAINRFVLKNKDNQNFHVSGVDLGVSNEGDIYITSDNSSGSTVSSTVFLTLSSYDPSSSPACSASGEELFIQNTSILMVLTGFDDVDSLYPEGNLTGNATNSDGKTLSDLFTEATTVLPSEGGTVLNSFIQPTGAVSGLIPLFTNLVTSLFPSGSCSPITIGTDANNSPFRKFTLPCVRSYIQDLWSDNPDGASYLLLAIPINAGAVLLAVSSAWRTTQKIQRPTESDEVLLS